MSRRAGDDWLQAMWRFEVKIGWGWLVVALVLYLCRGC